MSLGTAIILIMIVMAIAFAGLVLLTIFLIRKGKKHEAARKTYNIIAGIIGGIIFLWLGVIIFILPQPFSKKPCNFNDPRVVARNDSLLWMFSSNYDLREYEAFGIYNFNTQKLENICLLNCEGDFDFHPTSLAWNGKVLAVTAEGRDSSYVIATEGKKLLFKENLAGLSNACLSRDYKMNGFILAGTAGDYKDNLIIRKYDSEFNPISADTFIFDRDGLEFTFGPDEFEFLGGTWYANGAKENTCKLIFTGKYCHYEKFGTGSDSSFVLEGSLQGPDDAPDMITQKGIVDLGFPRRRSRNWNSFHNSHYLLSGDSISWRERREYDGDKDKTEVVVKDGTLTIVIHYPRWNERKSMEYEVIGSDSSRHSYFVYERYARYNYEDYFIRHNKLEIFEEGFQQRATFNLVTQEREDFVPWMDRVKVRFNNDMPAWFFYLTVIPFPLLLLGMIIGQRRKKIGKEFIPIYPYSLIYFLFIALPFLIWMWKVMLSRY